MKFRSLMTAGCLLAAATSVYAQPFAYVANSGTKNVSVIDTATNTVTATVTLADDYPAKPHPYAYAVAVSPSGQKVFVGLQDVNEVQVIDAATNAVVKRISLGTDKPGGLAVNAAETRLYVTSNMSNTLIVIDITGSGAAEVARVAVDDAAISNPEGVVLNPAGTKAYVASSTTSNIAEITLDETNNVYTRASLTSVNGSQPYGLAISSDGAKLYYSSLGGSAGVMDTSSKALKALTVGAGTVSIARTHGATSPMVYAPSNSLDKIYVIDASTDTVSGTQYAVSSAPMGSAVNADNSKLYLAMNLSDQVAVFNIPGNTFATPIALPAGAKPTSMGDFMGPDLPYTIAATNGANCTISPAGNVLVNNLGRTFTSTAASGTCEVKVDGVSVGQPSTYTFSNLTAGHTIDSSQIAGTFYTLSGDWISSIGGWVKSSPAGISQFSKSAKFLSGSSVTLSAGDTTNHSIQSGSWTGDCAGSGATCTLVMNADKTFGATVIVKPTGTGPLYDGSSYYQTLAEATTGATAGATIKISTDYITGGSTTGAAGKTVKLSGGWDASFSTQTIPSPKSIGPLTITNVAVIADNLKI